MEVYHHTESLSMLEWMLRLYSGTRRIGRLISPKLSGSWTNNQQRLLTITVAMQWSCNYNFNWVSFFLQESILCPFTTYKL